MRILILLLTVWGVISCSSKGGGDSVSGTVVDVNSGTLSGTLVLNNRSYRDSVEVYLYKKRSDPQVGDTLLAIDTTLTGNYSFSSLQAGSYYLFSGLNNGGVKFSAPVDVEVVIGENSVNDIVVSPLKKRVFEITSINTNKISVDSFSLEFGYVLPDPQIDNCFTLYFTSLKPSNSFGVSYKVDGVGSWDKMYLDVFNLKNFELSSSSNKFGVKNGALITKTGVSSDSSQVSFSFRGTTKDLPNLDTLPRVILSGDVVDTVQHKLSLLGSSVEFSFSRSFKAQDSVHFSVELSDTLRNSVSFKGDVGLRVVKDAVIDMPVELIYKK